MKSLFAKSTTLLAITALQVGLLGAPVHAEPAQCLSKGEAVAEKIRRLKTTLMVGALQCDNAPHLRVSETYNAFVETHGTAIKAHDQTLSSYFKRAFGNEHRRAMDRHMTSTANKVAGQSYKTPGFCDKIAALASDALTTSPVALLSVANRNVIAAARLPACEAPLIRAAQITR